MRNNRFKNQYALHVHGPFNTLIQSTALWVAADIGTKGRLDSNTHVYDFEPSCLRQPIKVNYNLLA